ncbi:MAG: hypothetical protein DRQ08_00435 [Candidatus Latescibacterota bacterium]|nr:MAG: hypothetical protein DRQ08_00435 [Candidatus Latescibacterota bacterium]
MRVLARIDLKGCPRRFLTFIVMLGFAFPAWGQYFLPARGFGQNKVRYRKFDWWALKTKYVEVYYNPEYEDLAKIAAKMADDAVEELQKATRHELSTVVPLILYETHYQFEQTNIVTEILPPGVGGFAESLRYRVVIPFDGNLDNLREVIAHEMTHIFQYDIIYGGPLKSLTKRIKPPPTWLMEGMAEYFGRGLTEYGEKKGGMEITGEMVLRDAVLSGTLIPLKDLDDFSMLSRVYLAYKESQSLVTYIARRFGQYKVVQLLRRWKFLSDSEKLIREVLGISREELERDWRTYLYRKYWPQIEGRKYTYEFAREVTPDDGRKGVGHMSPAWSLGGEMLAVLSAREGELGIELIRLRDGKVLYNVTKGMRAYEYEDLRFGEKVLAWSPDGRWIAFVGKRSDRDRIFVWDVYRMSLDRRLDPEGVEEVTSLNWSPDGRRLVISGIKGGSPGIFILDASSGRTQVLTRGLSDQVFPAWSPDGGTIAFSTRYRGSYDICLYKLSDGRMERLDLPGSDELTPCWFQDGRRLLLAVGEEGRYNLKLVDLSEGRLYQLTDVVGGVQGPAVSPDGRRIAFTAYSDGVRKLFVMDLPDSLGRGEEVRIVPLEGWGEEYRRIAQEVSYPKHPYRTDFSLDYAATQFAFSGSFFEAYAMFLAGDLFGNHRMFFLTDYTSFSQNISDMDFLFQYQYSALRMPFIFGILNWRQPFYLLGDDGYYHVAHDRQFALAAFSSYPIDRYRRIDFGYYELHVAREAPYTPSEEFQARIRLPCVAYVHDTVVWGPLGPMKGSRFYVFGGKTLVSLEGDWDFSYLDLDWRWYKPLWGNSVLAARFKTLGSFGPKGLEHFLGGPSFFSYGYELSVGPLRGYDPWAMKGTRVALANLEYRTVFIRQLVFGWPTTWSLGYIGGCVFVDAGLAWNEGESPRLVREGRLEALRCGVGFGLRMILGFIPVSLDFAKQTDLQRFLGPKKGFRVHLSLGWGF